MFYIQILTGGHWPQSLKEILCFVAYKGKSDFTVSDIYTITQEAPSYLPETFPKKSSQLLEASAALSIFMNL
ncbi:MAG: hypothetical protein HUJ51_00335 [Eggerthellaceae bacterium]|nr:hypothetical protein [Eggerthellaceae bacterium]